MKVLRVSDFALQAYRSFVNGNFNLNKDEVEKKLTRNVILGQKLGENVGGQVWYAYGQLRILVKNEEKITCVMNRKGVIDGWELDYDKKRLLNGILEIAQ